MIIKNFKYNVWVDAWDSFGKVGHGVFYLDPENMTIDVELLRGPDIEVADLFLFLLHDRDVRRLVEQYQLSTRKHKFLVRRVSHMSGAEDYYINFYSRRGTQKGGQHLLHVSCFGKMNEGFREMYVGDFVELVACMLQEGPLREEDLSNLKKIWRRTTCRYEKGFFDNGLSTTAVSKIL